MSPGPPVIVKPPEDNQPKCSTPLEIPEEGETVGADRRNELLLLEDQNRRRLFRPDDFEPVPIQQCEWTPDRKGRVRVPIRRWIYRPALSKLLALRVTVRDHDALTGIEPAAAARYLTSHGWRNEGARRAGLWVLEDTAGAVEILVPPDASYRDYALRMGDLLGTLEKIEDRSQLAILTDLIRQPNEGPQGLRR